MNVMGNTKLTALITAMTSGSEASLWSSTVDKVKASWQVRATFQRIVTRTDNTQVAETLVDPALHTEFFEKLSKAVFLEAQRI